MRAHPRHPRARACVCVRVSVPVAHDERVSVSMRELVCVLANINSSSRPGERCACGSCVRVCVRVCVCLCARVYTHCESADPCWCPCACVPVNVPVLNGYRTRWPQRTRERPNGAAGQPACLRCTSEIECAVLTGRSVQRAFYVGVRACQCEGCGLDWKMI